MFPAAPGRGSITNCTPRRSDRRRPIRRAKISEALPAACEIMMRTGRGLRPRNTRHDRQRDSATAQMQKLSATKFHDPLPEIVAAPALPRRLTLCEGDYRSAIADYNHAIEIDPDYSQAYAQRGWAFLCLDELANAEADF